MNGNRRTASFALMGVLIAAGIIGGVSVLQQQGFLGWNTTSILGQNGTLAAQITDPPNLPAGVTDVYIAYTDIQVHVADAGNQSGWWPIAKSGEINLTSVLNVRETIGSATVPTGKFNLVSFDISNAIVTYNGKNYTAYVPGNKITVPIADGGVEVYSASSIGFVIDISPTVIPYQNGTGTGFVLVPAASSIPIPQSNWHEGDDQQGVRDDLSQDSWWHQSENGLRGNLSIQSVALNSTSFSITLKNTGTGNVTLSAISILGNESIASVESATTESQVTSTSSADTATTTNTESASTLAAVETHMTMPETNQTQVDYVQEYLSVASFQVQSNGTLVQPHDGLVIQEGMVGLVIQSGQSVNLVFHGQIATIHEDLTSYSITSGQLYHIAALGEFDTTAYTNVTATA